jgi:beta-glucosidase
LTLHFPPSFIFGTSTSAYQVETAVEHDWQGLVAKDGFIFERMTDHEHRWKEDVEIISSLAPNYRMSLMWSRLQRAAFAAFDPETVRHYHSLLSALEKRNVKIMMVLHHWCNPIWFSSTGGWENKDNAYVFFDFATRLIDEFGNYVTWWNTFNEPNLYSTFAYAAGEFPPYRQDIFQSVQVIRNMGIAHERIANYIRQKFPHSLTGLSHNCVFFSADNITGTIPAKIADYWYMEYLPGFFESCDYVGLSYYARMGFDPFPVSFLRNPQKFNAARPHDDIWEYYPPGLKPIVERFSNKYGKAIFITENGICTNDDRQRVQAIKDYMSVIHDLLKNGIDVRGYFHWSAWDNFEWTLGPTYRFGLYSCDPVTMERSKRNSADLYSRLAYDKCITI